jgi:hypothetical protein
MPQTFLNTQAQASSAHCIPVASRRLNAPALLRLWHLTSLDAPTVAAVWSLAFAWAVGIRLPVWIPLLLALTAWAVYIADRLLDARAALRAANLLSLRERHRFHHRYRRRFVPLAIAAACAAACIVFTFMPAAARERDSFLAVAAMAYFTRVHSSSRLPTLGLSRFSMLWKKEMVVGVLFTAACVLPALSRAAAQTRPTLWPLLAAAVFFALLAWLNCHAIERWESEPSQQAGRESFFAAKPNAEKLGSEGGGGFNPRIKPTESMWALAPEGRFPPTSREFPSFSEGCKAPAVYASFSRWLKPPHPSASSATAACVLAFAGLLLACALSHAQPRSAALAVAGAVSALLLAVLDRFRNRLTPLALRAAADLVLLTPLAFLLR